MSAGAETLIAFLAVAIGTLGGIGGAVLLVPALVLGGVAPAEATTLGLMAVAAGSLAAAARQIDGGLVHHRLGVSIEVCASVGAFGGALAAGAMSDGALRTMLGIVALAAAGAGLVRGAGALGDEAPFAAESSGEWPGTLGGTYESGGAVVPYQARRLRPALGVMTFAGFIGGLSGTSGGFVKTPTMNLLMGVPVKVAASTTTFVSGLTAAAALVVRLSDTGVDVRSASWVVLGALAGGAGGARAQQHLATTHVATVLTLALAVAGILMIVR